MRSDNGAIERSQMDESIAAQIKKQLSDMDNAKSRTKSDDIPNGMLRIAGELSASIEDGPGYRYVLFVQGCPFNCDGCHNPESQPFSGGYFLSPDEILAKVKSNPLLDGMTFSGGEPFEQAAVLAELAQKVNDSGMNIVCYTGYTFEQILSSNDENKLKLLSLCWLLIDGLYVKELHSWQHEFRGSSNQRIIDIAKSLAEGKAVEWQRPQYCPF